jgi:cephalosporin-C deacetylase-like acetyl esterase
MTANSMLFCMFFFSVSLTGAANFTFAGTTDKNPLTYAAGEDMKFSVQLLESGVPVAGKNLIWTRFGDDGRTNEGKAVSSVVEPLVITTSIDRPGFIHIVVVAVDQEGQPLLNDGKQMPSFDGGACAALDQIKGWPEPVDFDEFWAGQKAKLAAVPLRADLVPVTSEYSNVLVFDVKVDCAGGMPVSGYFCKPKDAKRKSLPAHLMFRGYGVTGAGKPMAEGKNSLAMAINAHGILNGQPPEYYENLRKTSLSGYAFRDAENENPESTYFNGMFLRVMRALEFLKSQPEWDGKTLIVSGGSQGGLQALAGAGLDSDVSRCEVSIPWCCDLGGRNLGRLQSSFTMKWFAALGYYDGANHARRIKCPTTISAGLGDYISPPSSVVVLFHNLAVPKKLEFQQGRTHGYEMPNGARYLLTKSWPPVPPSSKLKVLLGGIECQSRLENMTGLIYDKVQSQMTTFGGRGAGINWFSMSAAKPEANRPLVSN